MIKNETQQKFGNLIKENQLLILKVSRIYTSTPQDCQDLFQEIVIQIWRAFPSFKGNSKITSWMYKIAIYTALMRVRKEKSALRFQDINDISENIIQVSYEPSDDENLEKLYTAISKLNLVEKAIVMLYLDGKSYDEMEEIIGINAGNLRVKMSRIKDKLKQLV
ncbi:RNA polymerase sigma factor [Arachidicoccus ginsenosidimutans]|uniref:RNA polymerase sigma factor n=1 Tax=Arachidicoccus sp. BS20 TaxID=1850526 RepID=UPI0018D3712E|nr:sigma-70 family RNA polymerase sigma factor [Arachidicoccus sp. BS20]